MKSYFQELAKQLEDLSVGKFIHNHTYLVLFIVISRKITKFNLRHVFRCGQKGRKGRRINIKDALSIVQSF